MVIRFKKSPRHAASGFSLVEIMVQLGVLITVSVPMIMMLNMQKDNITKDRLTTTNSILADQLFDNVAIQHPDPITSFQVITTPNTSIYCDPANKVKYPANANCGSGGSDVNRGPFFQRQLAYTTSPNNRALQVTVQLFRDATAGSLYYETSREYQLDAYRINTGAKATSANLNSLSPPNYKSLVQADTARNMWVPEYVNNVSLTVSTPQEYFETGCSGMAVGSGTGLPTPFNDYMAITCPSPGTSYYFKAVPNTTYDVNLYFVAPAGKSPGNSCISNSYGISCMLADFQVDAMNYASVDANLLKVRNYDIAAAAGLTSVVMSSGSITSSQGVVYHSKVTTSANANHLRVTINATTVGSTVNLAGVEVLRRGSE